MIRKARRQLWSRRLVGSSRTKTRLSLCENPGMAKMDGHGFHGWARMGICSFPKACTELHFAAGPKARNKPAHGNALGNGNKTDKALKGRCKVVPSIGKVVTPFQGVVRNQSATQGCARASLALGWLVTGLWPEAHTFGAPHKLNPKFRTGSIHPCYPCRPRFIFSRISAVSHVAESPSALAQKSPQNRRRARESADVGSRPRLQVQPR